LLAEFEWQRFAKSIGKLHHPNKVRARFIGKKSSPKPLLRKVILIIGIIIGMIIVFGGFPVLLYYLIEEDEN